MTNTLLKPKRHSLRCHGFMVHALLLRMHTNVVYFRVMRRLCRCERNWLWNWRCVNQHSWDPWQRTRDHGVWRLTLTAYTSMLSFPDISFIIFFFFRFWEILDLIYCRLLFFSHWHTIITLTVICLEKYVTQSWPCILCYSFPGKICMNLKYQ